MPFAISLSSCASFSASTFAVPGAGGAAFAFASIFAFRSVKRCDACFHVASVLSLTAFRRRAA